VIDKDTKVFFSVASNPGNKGSKFYNSYFKKKKINAIYIPLKLRSDFTKTFEVFKKIGIVGCSVSMPFKKQAWKLVDKKPNYLKKIKSINTILFNNNLSEGFSTDFYSVSNVLKKNNINKYKTIVIVGTGSMGKIFYKILNNKNNKIFFVSRKPKYKNQLKLSKTHKIKFDVLINASPLGMLGFQRFPIKNFNFSNCKKIIDVVAYPESTNLFKFANKKKIEFTSGEILAKLQAEKQLEIYKKVL
tara:strand:+ start:299 stop:1033 length:735 start_codon:yes stop_codon:yes gene_type:complete